MTPLMVILLSLIVIIGATAMFGPFVFLGSMVGGLIALVIIWYKFKNVIKNSEKLIKDQDLKYDGSFYEEGKGYVRPAEKKDPKGDNQLIEGVDLPKKEGEFSKESLESRPLPYKSLSMYESSIKDEIL